jgi:hypothetical protein
MIDPTCLLKGLEDAKQHRDRFNMDYFCKNGDDDLLCLDSVDKIRHDCGTVMCLAGWASNHLKPEYRKPYEEVDDLVILDVCGYDECYEAEDLSSIFYMDGDSTIEEVEIAVHQFIQKYNGVPAQ